VGLRYDDLPLHVIQRAKDCITDTVAVIVLGNGMPWSRIVVNYAQRIGAGGRSRILGAPGPTLHAPAAALANGTLAHAFESDNLTKPGAGVHPGATLLPTGLAIAQERGNSGRELITAVTPPNIATKGAASTPLAPPVHSAPLSPPACCSI
jgi:2-methylcitrate dehydratase PrpD